MQDGNVVHVAFPATADPSAKGGDRPVTGQASAHLQHQRLPACGGCCKFYSFILMFASFLYL